MLPKNMQNRKIEAVISKASKMEPNNYTPMFLLPFPNIKNYSHQNNILGPTKITDNSISYLYDNICGFDQSF